MNIPEPPEEWERDAACARTDTDLFYADSGEAYYQMERWQRMCFECPVRAPCLATALRNRENWGVWGGLTPDARKDLMKLLEAGACTWEQIERTFQLPE